MTIDFQKVADAIEKAPEEIKNLMFSVELGDKLLEIATIDGLDEEEPYLQMVDEVGYVILGLKEKSSFSNSLIQIGIEKNVAESVSKKIEAEVFSKIDRNETLVEKKDRIVRMEEISKKYSLNKEQSTKLDNLVTLVIKSGKKPDNFLQTTISELGISRLLAEQIMEDLEMRVFEYALKTVENKEKKGGQQLVPSSQQPVTSRQENKNTPNPTIVPKTVFGIVSSKISTSLGEKDTELTRANVPEIKPTNLPMVEKGEVAHDLPRQDLGEIPKVGPWGLESNTPSPKQPLGQIKEPVQQPVPVAPVPSQNISPPPDKTAEKTVEVPKETAHAKSEVDPYREPIS